MKLLKTYFHYIFIQHSSILPFICHESRAFVSFTRDIMDNKTFLQFLSIQETKRIFKGKYLLIWITIVQKRNTDSPLSHWEKCHINSTCKASVWKTGEFIHADTLLWRLQSVRIAWRVLERSVSRPKEN